MAWRPSAATATIVILLKSCVACAFADRTASDLITAMRFNDSVLQQCVFEGDVVEKILPPPPPRPHIFQVAIAGGQDITKLPGVDRLTELAIRYGTSSGVSLDDVPAEYLPLVRLIRIDKITMKLVKDDRPELVTHRNYGYVLASHRGDVAFHVPARLCGYRLAAPLTQNGARLPPRHLRSAKFVRSWVRPAGPE